MQIFIILICVLFLTVTIFPKCENGKKVDRKKIRIILVFLFIAPVLIYIMGTIILINVRGDCFVGHYVVMKEQVKYNNKIYSRVMEESEIEALNEMNWTYINTEQYITLQPVDFPYFEYWVPYIFYERLYLPVETTDYIIITSLDGSSVYYELMSLTR